MQTAKRTPLMSQDSINEEILVNQIVSQAWATHHEHKVHRQIPVKAVKSSVYHSKDFTVDTKHELSTQPDSGNQGSFHKGRATSASKPSATKKKYVSKFNTSCRKQPLRSQESINEEILVGQIMSEAWGNAEKLKKKKEKMRKQGEINRKRGKLHSQQSIIEEIEVKKIVNNAWSRVQHDSPSKLAHICENNQDEESSFEADSDSDSDQVEPRVSSDTETRRTTPHIAAPLHNEPAMTTAPLQPTKFVATEHQVYQTQVTTESTKQRRSRANRKGSRDYTSNKPIKATKMPTCYNPLTVAAPTRSPFKEKNTKITISNLDSQFTEDMMISPVKENRNLLSENYYEDI